MKRILSFLSILLVSILVLGTQVHAKDNSIYMNAAYWKGGDTFDIVVKETPGLQMKLYVNDKNPTDATANSDGWATFKKVSLSGSGKISFTWINSSQSEHPIDYTNKFSVSDPKATFIDDTPATPEPVTSTPAPQPQTVAPAQPAPTPQPSAYYKNCTEARSAGVTPIHRGEPGYAAHLDRDNDGIACE